MEPDWLIIRRMLQAESFNPRARVEPDTRFTFCRTGRLSFNPRARVEPDTWYAEKIVNSKTFQSTGSRGARHGSAYNV